MSSPESIAPGVSSSAPLPRTVRLFGVASLMTDAAGDMIYPLIPLFLTSVVGGSVAFVGIIEGVAESTAALLKLISGKIADRVPRKKPLVLFGYSLTSIVRPLVALATAPWMVLVIRFGDRVGKGIRGSPRDAMVAEVTPKELRGRAYGYHQAMDNAGAVCGPLIGFVMMVFLGLPLRTIFAWAAVPGALAVLAMLLVREKPAGEAPVAKPKKEASAAAQADAKLLYRYLVVLAIFTLGNASDAFLLLRAAQVLHPGTAMGSAAFADPTLLLLWSLHNLIKALLSQRAGSLSDRYGRRGIIALGWAFYALTYLAFAFASAGWQMWALFAFYGLYYSLVEGAEKALVADLTPSGKRGGGFGWYNFIIGMVSLPASALFGFLYKVSGAVAAFGTAAALAAVACVLLFTLVRPQPANG